MGSPFVFGRCVAKHRGENKVKDFSCLDQFFAMAFAQLTYRESLRDIEVNDLEVRLRANGIERLVLELRPEPTNQPAEALASAISASRKPASRTSCRPATAD